MLLYTWCTATEARPSFCGCVLRLVLRQAASSHAGRAPSPLPRWSLRVFFSFFLFLVVFVFARSLWPPCHYHRGGKEEGGAAKRRKLRKQQQQAEAAASAAAAAATATTAVAPAPAPEATKTAPPTGHGRTRPEQDIATTNSSSKRSSRENGVAGRSAGAELKEADGAGRGEGGEKTTGQALRSGEKRKRTLSPKGQGAAMAMAKGQGKARGVRGGEAARPARKVGLGDLVSLDLLLWFLVVLCFCCWCFECC